MACAESTASIGIRRTVRVLVLVTLALLPLVPAPEAVLEQGKVGVPQELRDAQSDRSRWPALRDALAAIFRTRTRAAWCALLEGTDVCFAPVLPLSEAARHPHIRARKALVEVEGVLQAAPAPRFSRTPSSVQYVPQPQITGPADVLVRWRAE